MSSSKEYVSYILEQLHDLEGITCRSMMGEYIIYYKTKIAAYICDDRFLVKPVESAKILLPHAVYEPPYPGAKDMLLLEDIDNREFLCDLLEAMYDELPMPKPKKKKKSDS